MAVRSALRKAALAGCLCAGLIAPGAQAQSANGAYAQRFAAVCAACHGAQGVSAMAGTPSLAGQHGFYAATQLFLFRAGRRTNPEMTAVAKDMSDADLRGFSDFIGQLPPAAGAQAQGPVDAQRSAQAQALARQHQCVSCHGADFSGDKQVPRVGGQREEYLARALREFKAGTRVGYTNAMNEALAGVSAAELDTLAWYLARQGLR